MLSIWVDEFVALLEAGKTLDAMERFYADEVIVFENRELARASKASCLRHEREHVSRGAAAPRFKFAKRALDERAGHVFLEYTIRFFDAQGSVMRLEQVAVQVWERGKIVEERFYYEGVVAEGDEP